MKIKYTYLSIFFALLFSCKKEKSTYTESFSNWNLDWMQTESIYFVDVQGRTVQLRGINQRIEGLFDVSFTDGRIANEQLPNITQQDIDSIAKMGFNCLRLPINWSAYEPEKDSINPNFIPRIREVVTWCKQAKIYVQLDWHFDAWSKEIGEDGAPYWTIYPKPAPKFQGPIDFNDLFWRRANPLVFRQYSNLQRNVHNLRTEYMQIWVDLITAFKDEPTVIGFEPFNEPVFYASGVSEQELTDLYIECSQKMRAIDQKHLLFLEPDAIRNFLNQSPIPKTKFPDNKVVYCPHYYPNLTLGVSYTNAQQWINRTNKDFDRVLEEGLACNSPVFLNEWGINPSTDAGKAMVTAYREQLENRNLNHAFWLWKEPLPGTSGEDGNWGFYDNIPNTNQYILRRETLYHFVVPYVMALPGKFTYHHFNMEDKQLTCEFNSNGSGANPILFIPQHWYPNGYSIFVDDSSVTYEADNFQRVAIQWHSQRGKHKIEVFAN